jgi:hypothetical protein
VLVAEGLAFADDKTMNAIAVRETEIEQRREEGTARVPQREILAVKALIAGN